MAIIHPFEVTISSGGELLREYDGPPDEIDDNENSQNKENSGSEGSEGSKNDQNPPSVLKYVEATEGARFKINYHVRAECYLGPSDCLEFATYVDGIDIGGPLCKLAQTVQTVVPQSRLRMNARWISLGGFTAHREGELLGSWTTIHDLVRPFRWVSLSTTENIPALGEGTVQKYYRHLGTIVVEIWSSKASAVTENSSITTSHFAKDLGAVPEVALEGKAIDLGVGVGAQEPTEGTYSFYHTSRNTDEPLAIFTFAYRSKSALHALGILPERLRNPESLPPPVPTIRMLLNRPMQDYSESAQLAGSTHTPSTTSEVDTVELDRLNPEIKRADRAEARWEMSEEEIVREQLQVAQGEATTEESDRENLEREGTQLNRKALERLQRQKERERLKQLSERDPARQEKLDTRWVIPEEVKIELTRGRAAIKTLDRERSERERATWDRKGREQLQQQKERERLKQLLNRDPASQEKLEARAHDGPDSEQEGAGPATAEGQNANTEHISQLSKRPKRQAPADSDDGQPDVANPSKKPRGGACDT